MPPLRILICGGGCAGPALAFWLARAGHDITICERSSALRATGAQIDLRAQGINVVKRMGLLPTIRRHLVEEDGVAFVDSQGKVKATLLANKSGKGAQSATSEYEIMRGDLVRILYEATTMDNVHYMFGVTVESFEQDDKHVVAHFSDHTTGTYDLLVGADGQGSRIRKAILPPDAPNPYRRLGLNIAYYFIPGSPETYARIRPTYHAGRGRLIFRRSHNDTETQIYLFYRNHDNDAAEMEAMLRASPDQQKQYWTSRFKDAGWQTPIFLEGMKTTQNWYCQEVVQVKTDTWSKGRVVLLGDAAHCPSPFSGMGTTGSFVGAYVLAGEICQNSEDLPRAFQRYDEVLRPFVNEIQKINPWFVKLALPETAWGVAILHFVVGLICWLRIPQLVARFSSEEKGGWKVPEYPELKYGEKS
ncbi:MAG: hypothetical protein OHK93_004698 [Ramalina farinacea]|uniref:FAD-binding domain-containing protein n=1 Tax=Ramalina farinacea TaxID=258253 RepID=A0AA43U0J9_9LECA|nr:hypothetical protein [Ramalina farinacea]